jgi:hypothetical protein
LFIFYVLIGDYIANSHFTLAVYAYKGLEKLKYEDFLGLTEWEMEFKAYELGAPNKFTQEQVFDSIN